MYFIILGSAGCTNLDKNMTPENMNTGKIYTAELTEEQQDIIALIGVESDIDMFEYVLRDTYEAVSIWVEVYKEGECISTCNRMSFQIQSDEGKIAVIVDRKRHYDWKISQQDDHGISSTYFNSGNDFETDDAYSVGSGALNQPVEILPEKEIVLETFLFDKGNSMSIYDNQHYAENSEVLKEYDYAYLVKCQFYKEEIDDLYDE